MVRGRSAVSSGDGRNWHQDQEGEQVPSVLRHLFLPSPHLLLTPDPSPGSWRSVGCFWSRIAAASCHLSSFLKKFRASLPPFSRIVPRFLPAAGISAAPSFGSPSDIPLQVALAVGLWPVPVPGRCSRAGASIPGLVCCGTSPTDAPDLSSGKGPLGAGDFSLRPLGPGASGPPGALFLQDIDPLPFVRLHPSGLSPSLTYLPTAQRGGASLHDHPLSRLLVHIHHPRGPQNFRTRIFGREIQTFSP